MTLLHTLTSCTYSLLTRSWIQIWGVWLLIVLDWNPQLSIISDSSCSRSSSPRPGSTSSSRWSPVNSLISSSNSSTTEVEAAVVRDTPVLCLRGLGVRVGVFRMGLTRTDRLVIDLLTECYIHVMSGKLQTHNTTD